MQGEWNEISPSPHFAPSVKIKCKRQLAGPADARMLPFQAWPQSFLRVHATWITHRSDGTAQGIIAPVTRQSTLRCEEHIPVSAEMTFKVPSKPKGLWSPVLWMQALRLSFYVQKGKAAGLGNRARPPVSSAGHCSQWGLTYCQEKSGLVGGCYRLRVRPASSGRSDKSQGQQQFSSFIIQAVRPYSVSWVPLHWDLDHKGQSSRRAR